MACFLTENLVLSFSTVPSNTAFRIKPVRFNSREDLSSSRICTCNNAIQPVSSRRSMSRHDFQSNFPAGERETVTFSSDQLNKVTSWALSTTPNRPIVAEYEPGAFWLWTQWKGTFRELTYKNALLNMMWALLVNFYAYYHYIMYILATNGGDGNIGDASDFSNFLDVIVAVDNVVHSGGEGISGVENLKLLDDISWLSFEIPYSNDPFVEILRELNTCWEYLLSMAIFTLSFFTNQAYDHWRTVYFSTRSIQTKINELCFTLTMGTIRPNDIGRVNDMKEFQSNNLIGQSGDKKRDSQNFARDIMRLLRLSHTFFWAAIPTRSDGFGDVPFTEGGIMGDLDSLPKNYDPSMFGSILLTPEGLEIMVRQGQLTQQEVDALLATGLPPSQYSDILLEWAGLRAMAGFQSGEICGGQGVEENLIQQFNHLRGEYTGIGDAAAGRMPMAYMVTMQVLVDLLVVSSPLALYPKVGAFTIFSTALLTFFFKGFLELSKSFLDPFGKERSLSHNIRVDVLVSEINLIISKRWMDVGDSLPPMNLDPMKSYELPAGNQVTSSDEDTDTFDKI